MINQTLNNDLTQIERTYISTLDADAVYYKHVSGMTLFHIEAKDSHKTFSFSFKTPPKDDTGVCHIIEHSVCVASKKYPLRDTFMALDQGSINTTLNACTYKDMTTYYGASLHEEDLINMMTVYVDLLFNPLMVDYPSIFRQEGWGIGIEEVDGEEMAEFTGIVYNEMAGEYTEGSAFLDYELNRALFPDTYYQYDAGGVPEQITTLTYEEMMAYYNTYYTTENMTLVLYGDINLEQVLATLKPLEKQEVVDKETTTKKEVEQEQVPIQKAFDSPKRVQAVYPIEEEDEASHYLALGFVTAEIQSHETKLAFMMLEHMLLKSAASPLVKVLVEEEKLGISIGDLGYDTGKKQPTFSVVLQGAKANDYQRFEECVMNCLKQLADKGIPKDLKDAAFHHVRFGQHEGDWGGEIPGLVYSEWIQMAALYGQSPFESLNDKEALDTIAKDKDNGYFEALIRKAFLANNHRVTLSLAPSSEAYEESREKMDEKLEQRLTDLAKEVEEMDEDWWEDDTSHVLPSFDRSKLIVWKKLMPYQYEEVDDTRFVISSGKTKGIAYMQFLFDARCVEEKEIPYVGLLAHLLSYIRTERYGYEQLENQINQVTGALNCSVNSYSKVIGSHDYQPYFKLSCKILVEYSNDWYEVVKSILTETRFDENNRMRDLVKMIRHDYEKNFVMAPEYRAVKRLYSYFSPIGVYEDQTSGFAFYHFIKELDNNWEGHWEQLQTQLQVVYKKLFRQNNLTIGLTTDCIHQEQMVHQLKALKAQLPKEQIDRKHYHLQMYQPNEAFTMTSQVQAIAKGYDFVASGITFHGSMYVVAHLLNTTYLWDTIRLEGGAYGADISFTRDGSMAVVSYCDPNLRDTLRLFDEIAVYLETIELTKEEIDRLVIGTVGQMDYPLTNEEKSEQVLTRFLCELSDEKLQKEREEVLETDLAVIREVAKVFKTFAQSGVYCVIGNKEKIQSNKVLFTKVNPLV